MLSLRSQFLLLNVSLHRSDSVSQRPHACRTVNDLIWKEIQEKNAQFKADNDAFWEAEQVYRKWYAEDRKRRRAPSPPASAAFCRV